MEAVVIAAQHEPSIDYDQLKNDIIEQVIHPICGDYLSEDTKFLVNETGQFVVGGPQGDTGMTGRKIIVDTYGGMGRHGGGAFFWQGTQQTGPLRGLHGPLYRQKRGGRRSGGTL